MQKLHFSRLDKNNRKCPALITAAAIATMTQAEVGTFGIFEFFQY